MCVCICTVIFFKCNKRTEVHMVIPQLGYLSTINNFVSLTSFNQKCIFVDFHCNFRKIKPIIWIRKDTHFGNNSFISWKTHWLFCGVYQWDILQMKYCLSIKHRKSTFCTVYNMVYLANVTNNNKKMHSCGPLKRPCT